MFKRMIILTVIFIYAAIPVFAGDEGLARITYGPDRWMALHILLQAQAYTQNEYDVQAGETGSDAVWGEEFQLRRSRIMLNGEVTKNIEFFMSTEDFFIGSNEYSSTTTVATSTDSGHSHTVEDRDSKGVFILDGYVNYRIMDQLEFTAGLMPVPFMHQNMESSASLLGIDYNSLIVPLGNTEDEWRDTGIVMRGLLAKAFDYRIGIFRGQARDLQGTEQTSDDINPYSAPRVCVRFQMNFLDPENGFFYSGNYLGRKNVISLGAGLDYQNHAARVDNKISHYAAWTVDLTVDYKIEKEMIATFQGAYINTRNNPGSNLEQQSGYFAQAGLLIGSIQPVIRYSSWDQDDALSSDPNTSYLSTGINYYLSGHNANIKLEYQNPMGKDNKSGPGEKKATLQFQVFL